MSAGGAARFITISRYRLRAPCDEKMAYTSRPAVRGVTFMDARKPRARILVKRISTGNVGRGLGVCAHRADRKMLTRHV